MSAKQQSMKLDELKVIADISDLFASTLSLNDTLQETISLVSRLTHADTCFLYLYQATTSELVLSASKTPHPKEIGHIRLKWGEGITGWVAQHKKPVALSKGAFKDKRFIGTLPEDSYEAFLSVPIMIKNNVVGVINVQHIKPHTYPPRLINLLTTIGRQVGSAIETARLYDETNRRAKALKTLSVVSDSLARDGYQNEIMDLIVRMTAQMMGSNICSVMLLDEKKQELKVVAAQALDPEYMNKPPVKVQGSLTGRVVQTRQPMSIPDVRKEAPFQYRDLAIKQGLVSLLSVPMIYKTKVLGVLNTYTPAETKFSKEEISFVQSIANQCAAAMENTRLLTEKLAAQEALESRKVVEKAKGILMSTKSIPEQEAFREIQRQSMNRRKSMKEISEAIILAHELRP
jgi:signal transduction protein with GAF and PtsI domain